MRIDTSVFDGPGRPLLHELDQGGVLLRAPLRYCPAMASSTKSKTPPEGSPSPSGQQPDDGFPPTKAGQLRRMVAQDMGDGIDFPLDAEIQAELMVWPGPMPKNMADVFEDEAKFKDHTEKARIEALAELDRFDTRSEEDRHQR